MTSGIMKILKIILVNCVIVLALMEVMLRIFWHNPYVPPQPNVYLHHPDTALEFHHIDELYEGAPDPVNFRTSHRGRIVAGDGKYPEDYEAGTYAIAVGGSTTESATVQEGKRWPDMLEIPTFNFGKSRLHSVHSYYNIKHLLEVEQLKPKYVFVMDGVNNLTCYLKRGRGALAVETYEDQVVNPVVDFIVKHIYTAAFLWRMPKQWNYLHFYRYEAEKSRNRPVLTDAEFDSYLRDNREAMTAELARVFAAIDELAVHQGAAVIILTQPHAYRDTYRSFSGYDLRAYPGVDGKRFTLEQARTLFDTFNELTMDAAHGQNMAAIDVAECLVQKGDGDLIYDGFHFTEKGSERVASCVNDGLRTIEINSK